MSVNNISNNCINLVKKYEGCYLTAYRCSANVLTIGYGTTNADKAITHCNITEKMTITQAKADEWLLNSLKSKYLVKVTKYNKIYNWNQNQLDALVSFAYNIGSIDGLTNNGKRTIAEISKKILEYNTCRGANGKKTVLKGLTRRREEEKKLFDTPIVAAKPIVKTVEEYKKSNIQELQSALNNSYGLKLSVDGILGENTKSAIKNHLLKQGSKNAYVLWLQKELKSKGYAIVADGIFGNKTTKILKQFQTKNKLKIDGICGYNVIMKLLS